MRQGGWGCDVEGCAQAPPGTCTPTDSLPTTPAPALPLAGTTSGEFAGAGFFEASTTTDSNSPNGPASSASSICGDSLLGE